MTRQSPILVYWSQAGFFNNPQCFCTVSERHKLGKLVQICYIHTAIPWSNHLTKLICTINFKQGTKYSQRKISSHCMKNCHPSLLSGGRSRGLWDGHEQHWEESVSVPLAIWRVSWLSQHPVMTITWENRNLSLYKEIFHSFHFYGPLFPSRLIVKLVESPWSQAE